MQFELERRTREQVCKVQIDLRRLGLCIYRRFGGAVSLKGWLRCIASAHIVVETQVIQKKAFETQAIEQQP